MKRELVFFAFLAILLFTQCNNEKIKTPPPPSVSQVSSAPTTAKGYYKHFKGTIDTLPITMDLVKIHNKTTESTSYNFSGHYYYDKYQQPISLYGELDSVGNIILHESNHDNKELQFVGKIADDGTFSGTWQDTAAKKSLPFSLKETYNDGALAFDFFSFEDSVKAFENNPKTPIGTFDLQALTPSQNVESTLATFLKDKIIMGIKGDTIEKSYANMSLENLSRTLKDTFANMYRESVKDEKAEETGEFSQSLNYTESSTAHVIFNEKDWLSMAYSAYSYGGGAHGNYASAVATYDLTQKRVLKLSDVFLPKFDKTLNTALTNAVRRQFSLKKTEPLSSVLFDNSIEYTNNFCITKKGITFVYNPYEIAAYAMGEIHLFIPFEEIKSVVNPRFLQ